MAHYSFYLYCSIEDNAHLLSNIVQNVQIYFIIELDFLKIYIKMNKHKKNQFVDF